MLGPRIVHMTNDTHWLTVTSNCHCNAWSGFFPFHTWTAASLCQIDMAHMIHQNTSDSNWKVMLWTARRRSLSSSTSFPCFGMANCLETEQEAQHNIDLSQVDTIATNKTSDMFSQVNLNFELNVNQRHWHSWITRSLLLALQRPWSSSWASHADSTFLSQYWTLKRGHD